MPGKEKENGDKIPVLKGSAAEKKVLDYVKEMNRPFGAADIFANIKGVVAKASVQKILVALAEKGEITQKAYGKTLVFVANQAGLDEMPVESYEALEVEEKCLTEEIKSLSVEVKMHSQELARIRNSPTNEELEILLSEIDQTLCILHQQLEPLRSGQPLITAEEMTQLDAEFQKWRLEWVQRKKVFLGLWSVATDAMTPQESLDLVEDLGIEYDTSEHAALEAGPLCKPPTKGRR